MNKVKISERIFFFVEYDQKSRRIYAKRLASTWTVPALCRFRDSWRRSLFLWLLRFLMRRKRERDRERERRIDFGFVVRNNCEYYSQTACLGNWSRRIRCPRTRLAVLFCLPDGWQRLRVSLVLLPPFEIDLSERTYVLWTRLAAGRR